MRRPFIWEVPGLTDMSPKDRDYWITEDKPGPILTSGVWAAILGMTQRNFNMIVKRAIAADWIEIPIEQNGRRNITLFHAERLLHYCLRNGLITHDKFASSMMVIKGIGNNHKVLW